jgi:hypothetical protein
MPALASMSNHIVQKFRKNWRDYYAMVLPLHILK